MDYSLLVGIHDPNIPSSSGVNQDEDEANEDDEYMYVEDGEGQYVSSDELEAPHSPSSTTGNSHTFCISCSFTNVLYIPLCITHMMYLQAKIFTTLY